MYKKQNNSGQMLLILVLALAGAAIFIFFFYGGFGGESIPQIGEEALDETKGLKDSIEERHIRQLEENEIEY